LTTCWVPGPAAPAPTVLSGIQRCSLSHEARISVVPLLDGWHR
jgi:hypothetical protein